MKNKLIYSILFLLIILNISLFGQKEYKLSTNQKKIIKQAKALEKSGLLYEAKNIYKNLLNQSPFIDEAFNSLKRIELLNNNFEALIPYSNNYIEAHNYDISKIPNVFEIFILSNSNKVDETIEIIKNINNPKTYGVTKIISILLDYKKSDKALNIIEHIRNNGEDKSFYSLQLGMFYSIQGNIKLAIGQYIIYLQNNKQNINIISNRVMSLTDNPANINSIKGILYNSTLLESKIILSQLEFKLKNYNSSYEILDKYNANDNIKIALIEDLIQIEEYKLSEKIINSIIEKSTNEKFITKSIFLLAQLFEKKLLKKSNQLPISKLINANEIINSPFKKINQQHSNLLNKAINIYDSLHINLKDFKSTFHLAEIKYRIQGDLDGALILYTDIFKNSRSFDYKINSLERIIDVYHSKGDIDGANKQIEKYLKSNNKKIKMILNIKKIQNYFYSGNKELLLTHSHEILKDLSKENRYYNDILDMISITYLINNKNEFENYTLSKFKIMQNKRILSINLLDSLKSESPEVNDRISYEKSYLNVMHGDYNKALNIINKINQESIYSEYSILLKGEIFDYLIEDKSQAVDTYLLFLDLFPSSVYYDLIRMRLREIANEDV